MHSALLLLCSQISRFKMENVVFYTDLLQYITTCMSLPYTPHLEVWWLEKNKVYFYDLDKEGTVKINGEYGMPMGLLDIHI